MDQTQILVQIYLTAGGEALTRIRSSGHMGSIADRRWKDKCSRSSRWRSDLDEQRRDQKPNHETILTMNM